MVSSVCIQTNDIMIRMRNIVVYNVPEGTTSLKADNAIQDNQLLTKLSELITDGKYQQDVLQVRRLGSKQANETETRNRPLLVAFPDEDNKALVMKNLYKLKKQRRAIQWNECRTRHEQG